MNEPIKTNFLSTEPIQEPKRSKKILYSILGVIGFLLVVALGFVGYIYASNRPDAVWKKFVFSQVFDKDSIEKSHVFINLAYKDNFSNQSLTASADVDLQTDPSDPQNIKSKLLMDLKYSLGSVNAGIDAVEMITSGDDVYFNVSNIPGLNILAQEQGGWVKISSSTFKNDSENPANQKFTEEFQKIFNSKELISSHTYQNSENIEGVKTHHYKIQFNNQLLQNDLKELFGPNSELWKEFDANAVGKDITESESAVIQKIVSSIEIADADLWVGVKDRRVHKINVDLKFPSFLGIAFGSVQAKSDDSQKLSDLRQMTTALELYYNENGGYPDAKNGYPANLIPDYIGEYPRSPRTEGEVCTPVQQYYTYAPVGKSYLGDKKELVFPDFKLTSCLNSPVSGYPAGEIYSSSKGMFSISGTVDQEFAQTPEQESAEMLRKIDEAIKQGSFGHITFGLTARKVDPNFQANIPSNFYDFSSNLETLDE
jgi:hypothetical protein